MTLLHRLYDVQTPETPPVPVTPEPAMKAVETDDEYGKFVVEPLPRGRGMTIGNSLRRMLLGAIGGSAVTWAKIAGVRHEYESVPGMREDVNDFLLNLKGIRVRSLAPRPGRLRLEVDGEGEVRAGDIMASADFEIVNPEHHLATLDSASSRLSVEMNVEQGVGYRTAEHDDGLPIGVLPIDAVFSAVRKASFAVEPVRGASGEEMDRLTVEVWTDRTVKPVEALQLAADAMMKDLYLVLKPEVQAGEPQEPTYGLTQKQFNTRVEDLGLSARTRNSLLRHQLKRVGEIVALSDADLLKIRNFGTTSLDELRAKLEELGITKGSDAEADAEAGTETEGDE